MELNTIQDKGRWTEIAKALNDNFVKIAQRFALGGGSEGGGGGMSTDEIISFIEYYLGQKDYVDGGELYVALLSYATKTELKSVDDRLKAIETFFEEDDDELINKWNEIVDFLNNIEGDTLHSILSTKADKADSLEGYGILDAYDKTQIDDKVTELNAAISGKANASDLGNYLLLTDFNASNIKTTLGISDWALSANKPTYTANEVGALAADATANETLKMTPEYLTDLNKATAWRFFDMTSGYGSTDGNKPTTYWVSGITGCTAANSKYKWQLARSTSDDRLYWRAEDGGEWKFWDKIAFTSDIPTNLSQLTDDILCLKGRYIEVVSNTDADTLTNGVYFNQTGNGSGNANFPDAYSTLLAMTAYGNYAAQISITSKGIKSRNKLDTWRDWVTHLSDKNFSDYALPISGGTLAGDLTANIVSAKMKMVAGSYIQMYDVDNSTAIGILQRVSSGHIVLGSDYSRDLYLDFNNVRCRANNSIFSNSITAPKFIGALQGNADSATIVQMTANSGSITPNDSLVGLNAWYNNSGENMPAVALYSGITIKRSSSHSVWELASQDVQSSDIRPLWFRRGYGDEYTDWKQIAFTDSNVASASSLSNYFSSRPTSANQGLTGKGRVFKMLATSAMTDKKPMGDGHIIHSEWDNASGYDAQLYIPNNSFSDYHPQWRAENGGAWGQWITLIDSTNIGSYHSGSAAKLLSNAKAYAQVGGNNILFGWELAPDGYDTLIAGRSIQFRHGLDRALAMDISSAGDVSIHNKLSVGGEISGNLKGNADSATKLATPRTIWGVGFDGTKDIGGNINLSYNKLYCGNDIDRFYIGMSNTTYDIIYEGAYGHSFKVNKESILAIASDKKVGIGTTTPSAKLEVNGNIKSSSWYGAGISIGCGSDGTASSTYSNEINCFGSTLYLQHRTGRITMCANGGFVGIGRDSAEATLDVNGSTIIRGSIYFSKGQAALYAKAKDDTSDVIFNQVNPDGHLLLGQGVAKDGGDTLIYGNNIRFCYGTAGSSSHTALQIDSTGNTTVNGTLTQIKDGITISLSNLYERIVALETELAALK